MSKTPEQTIIDTSVDPSLNYLQPKQVSQLVSSENGIITTRTDKGVVYNTVENVTKVVSKVIETNVVADWTAEEGTSFIKNKPNLEVYATTVDVNSKISNAIGNLINGAPTALNTLNELASALGNNASYASTITNALANKAETTYVDGLFDTLSQITTGNIVFSDTAMSVANVTKDVTLTTGGNQEFKFGHDGNLTVPGMLLTGGAGTPRFSSASDFIIHAENRVKIENASFKLAPKTNTQRSQLLGQAGDMIFNTTTNQVQVYVNGAWSSLGGSGLSADQSLNTTDNVEFNSVVAPTIATNRVEAPTYVEVVTLQDQSSSIDLYTNWDSGNASEVWIKHNDGVYVTTNSGAKSWKFDQDGYITTPTGSIIGGLEFGHGIGLEGEAPTVSRPGGAVIIQGGQDMSEAGGPHTAGGFVEIRGGQGANDVDQSQGGGVSIYAGPASQVGGGIRIESGSTYGASGQAGDILIQSGSSVSGVAGNITIQSGVGTEGMQVFEGALKLRGANVDITSAFESVKIRTGDVDQISNPAKVWEFDNTGNLVLPQGNLNASPAPSLSGIVFSDGSFQSTAYTGLGNITFSGDVVSSINDIVNVVGNNYSQLQSNNTYIWVENNEADVEVGSSRWTFSTPTVNNSSSNALTFPNDVVQRSGDYVNCNPNMDTVIYTTMHEYHQTVKLLINIEGVEDGQSQADTQSCEMMVAKTYRNNSVAGSAYGLVYTSANPLATLSTRWNSTTNRIEIVCRPTSTMNGVNVHTSATELLSASY